MKEGIGRKESERKGGRGEVKQTSYINWTTDSYETRIKIIFMRRKQGLSLNFFANVTSIFKF